MIELGSPTVLNTQHDVSAFGCGKAPLNEWLRHALAKQNAMISRTYVVTNGVLVVGYYTLTHSAALQTEVLHKLGRGMPNVIPAMLMARFAIDVNFQGQGLGRSLLVDALRRTWAVIKQAPRRCGFSWSTPRTRTPKRFTSGST